MPAFDIASATMVGLALAFAAFVQGFSGFGYGILAMAVVSLFAPNAERVSVVVTLTGLCVQLTLAVMSWRRGDIDWAVGGLLLAGMVVGIPLGYWFLRHTGQHPRPVFRGVFGIVLLAFALNGLLRPHLRRPVHAAWAPPVGWLSGGVTGAFVSGGPPLVLYLCAREHDPRQAKGTLQLLFVSGSLIRLLAIGGTGAPITPDLLKWAAAGAPLVVAVALAGHWLGGRVSVRTFSTVIYALVALAGLLQLQLARAS